MKRKSIVVLLVLLLVGILAFTAFACNNDKNKKPNNPGTDTPGGDDPNPGGDDNTEDTNAINEAIPALLGGLDQVAAKVGDVSDGAYLKANIALGLSLDEEIDLDLKLSLAASMDKETSAKNWALIGLGTSEKDIVNLYIKGTDEGKEIIYLGEILTTGETAWHEVSVLDVSASETLDGIFLSKSENDNNSGLIERVFNFLDSWEKDGQKLLGPIDFNGDAPISDLSFNIGSEEKPSILVLGELLTNPFLSPIIPQLLSAKATENGYSASLVIEGLSSVLPLLSRFIDPNALSPFTELLLGLKIKDGAVTPVDEDDATPPSLNINFDLAENGDLSMLEIAFANDNVSGHSVALSLKIDGIEAEASSKAAEDPAGITNADDLGLNLGLELDIPAWDESAKIDISINPNAKIGFNADGKVEIDLSNVDGYAKFNDTVIAEYCTYTIDNVETKGFAIDLGAVYDFIKPLADGATATDLRDNIYFIKCDLDTIVYNAMYPVDSPNNLSNAAYANEDEATGALAKLISAIKAGVTLNNINNVIGPILTDSNNLVGLLLGLFDGPITLDPALGEDVNGSIEVTADLAELVEYVMNDNLLGGIEDMINISMYDVSAASTEGSNEDKTPYTLSQILDGQTDLVEVIIDLVYTAMFEAEEDATKAAGFNAYITSLGDSLITREKVVAYAKKLGITLDDTVTAADFKDLVAEIIYGKNGLSASISILGVKLSLSADLDEYVVVNDSIIAADADVKVITSWADFNAENSLQNALMELAGYAMLNIETEETPAA